MCLGSPGSQLEDVPLGSMLACKRGRKQTPLMTGIYQRALGSPHLLQVKVLVARRCCCEHAPHWPRPWHSLRKLSVLPIRFLGGRCCLRKSSPGSQTGRAITQCQADSYMDATALNATFFRTALGVSHTHPLQGTETYLCALSGPCGERRGKEKKKVKSLSCV